MFVFVCVCVRARAHTHTYVFINPSARAGCDTRSILSGVKQVWIQSFPFPRLLVNLLIGGRRIISAMWNAISFVQDLNSYGRVSFLRRSPLHSGHKHVDIHSYIHIRKYINKLVAYKWKSFYFTQNIYLISIISFFINAFNSVGKII